MVPSETTTAWAPCGAAGIVKVTVPPPLAFEVPPAVIVAALPPTVTVRACEAWKPETVRLTRSYRPGPSSG